MRTLKNRDTRNSPIAFIITWLLLTFISMLLTLSLKAQDYQKLNKRANKSYYRKQTSLYLHACKGDLELIAVEYIKRCAN